MESVGEVGDEEAPPRRRDVVEEIRKYDVVGRPNLHRNTSSSYTRCGIIRGRVPTPLPRIGRAVICNGRSAVENVGKLNIIGQSCSPRYYCQQFRFETGCVVYV